MIAIAKKRPLGTGKNVEMDSSRYFFCNWATEVPVYTKTRQNDFSLKPSSTPRRVFNSVFDSSHDLRRHEGIKYVILVGSCIRCYAEEKCHQKQKTVGNAVGKPTSAKKKGKTLFCSCLEKARASIEKVEMSKSSRSIVGRQIASKHEKSGGVRNASYCYEGIGEGWRTRCCTR